MNEREMNIIRHPSDQCFDKGEVIQVERWKVSDLSGSEWRFSWVVKLWRKGRLAASCSVGDPAYAAIKLAEGMALGPGEISDAQGWEVHGDSVDLGGECCQPGCTERPMVIYRLRRLWDWTCSFSKENRIGSARAFCARHRHRGDCGRDDSDANYEAVEGES